MTQAPSRRARLLVSVAIGVATAAYFVLGRLLHPGPPDFDQVWFGARAIWAGENPYDLVGPGRVFDWPWPLYYPVTALLVVSPLALLPVGLARLLFVGGSAALLSYGITRESWVRLPVFGSCSFALAVLAAQWSPLLTAMLCIPALAWLVPAKPNIGLAILAYSPTGFVLRLVASSAIGLAILGFILLPSWPRDWLSAVRSAPHFTAPLQQWGGPLLLVALLRWRRPEARLIAALAVVPQNMVIYATLPLFLVPRTFREALALTALNNAAFLFILLVVGLPQSAAENYYQCAALVALCYLPALIMVLRRPNEGDVPASLDRAIARVRRRWLSAKVPVP